MSAHVRETSQRIKRILIVRTDRLGDVILTLPILPILRHSFPHAHIAMLLRRYTGEVLEGNPYVDELLWYDQGNELVPFDVMCRTIRERRFDVAVVVYPRLRLAWLMYRSRIPVRIGTGYRYYSFLFTRRVYEHRKDARRHELEYNLNLLKEMGCDVPEDGYQPEFFIDISDRSRRDVELLLRSRGVDPGRELIVVHPGSGGSAREWPAGSFGLLAAKMISQRDVQVVVTGGRGEERKAEEVVATSGGGAVSVAGELTIKELAALARMSDLFVANSTGPLHLAVAVGTPVVGLYPQATPMSARRWGPFTERKVVLVPEKPLDCKECVEKNTEHCSCMASITVEQVYNASCSLLKKRETHA